MAKALKPHPAFGIAPAPWKVAESMGGKVFIYDAKGKPVIVPNMTQTAKTKEQLVTLYMMIVSAVNLYEVSDRQEQF